MKNILEIRMNFMTNHTLEEIKNRKSIQGYLINCEYLNNLSGDGDI